jgi:hypothetical protein
MGKLRIKPNYRRRVLRLPGFDHCKLAVLNSLGSPASRRVYEYAIDQFIAWCSFAGNHGSEHFALHRFLRKAEIEFTRSPVPSLGWPSTGSSLSLSLCRADVWPRCWSGLKHITSSQTSATSDALDIQLTLSSAANYARRSHVRKAGGWVIVSFENSLEDDDWDDGTGWMGSLMSLRSELLRGDIRCLYLGWLLCAQNEEFAEDELEPAVPAGLGELSAPLHSLIEFLGIDENLVEVAATVSAPLNAGPDWEEELATWIQSLPEKEKNNLLVAAVSGTGERWKQGLLRRFGQQTARRTLSAPDTICRRTAGDLLRLVHARVEERARLLEAKRAAEAARRKAEDEANRSRYLDQLGKREAATWNQIAAHIQKRQPNEYDKAVTLLTDLRDLAVRQGRVTAFQSALRELRQEHAAKESLLRRLTKAKL